MPKTIPIFLEGDHVAWVMAGPTRDLPDDRALIRCAVEIPVPPERVAYDVATKDFTPFDDDILLMELPRIRQSLLDGESLYVGCMGGVGRTGTLLSILVGLHPALSARDAIAYVRKIYDARSVETPAQEQQVARIIREFRLEEVARTRDPEIEALITQGYYVDPAPEPDTRPLLRRIWDWLRG